jgi:hypothetical protein
MGRGRGEEKEKREGGGARKMSWAVRSRREDRVDLYIVRREGVFVCG